MDRIVVGIDGSDGSRTALRWAAEEAGLRGCSLDVVYVYDYVPAFELYEYPTGLVREGDDGGAGRERSREQAREHAERLVDRLVADLPTGGRPQVRQQTIEDRRPARALVDQARGAQLLVVGSRGRGGFAGLVLGSVSQQCVQHASCPVVVIPTRDGDPVTA